MGYIAGVWIYFLRTPTFPLAGLFFDAMCTTSSFVLVTKGWPPKSLKNNMIDNRMLSSMKLIASTLLEKPRFQCSFRVRQWEFEGI